MLMFSSQYVFLWGEENCQELSFSACAGIYEKPTNLNSVLQN